MSNRASKRIFVAVFALLCLIAPVAVHAQCGIPTAYNVQPAATGSVNWTDTTGLWAPAGGYPGCTPGDSASNPATTMPLTVVVNSSIPNPIIGLNWSAGQMIDIQTGGSLVISGPASIAGGAKIQVDGGVLTITSGGTLTVDASSFFYLESGTIDVQSGGQLILNGTNTVDPTGLLQVNGGTLTVNSSLAFPNGSGLTLNSATVDGSSSIDNSGGVDNSSGNSTVSIPLNNLTGAGGVSVSSGVLSLTGGGNGDAPFTIAADGVLEFPSGTYTMGTGGTVTGAGTLTVSGGTLSIGGVTDPANFTMTSGTLTGAGFLSVAGLFNWDGGELTGTGGTEIAGTGIGHFTGSAGTMSLNGRVFNVYGYVNYTATTNPLELVNGATFAVYGTFDFQDDGSVTCNCALPSSFVISPNGFVKKTGGAGISVIAPPTTNNYDVAAYTGTLEFAGDGTHNGFFYAAPTGKLLFSASNTTLDPTSYLLVDGIVEFTGSATLNSGFNVFGLMHINGGNVAMYQPSDTTNFIIENGGVFYLGSTFSMYGTGTWSAGTIAGNAGPFTVEAGATLTIDAAGCVPLLSSIELKNEGTINYTPTLASTNHLEMAGSSITNNGLFDMQADAPIAVFSFIIGDSVGGCSASSAMTRLRPRSEGLILAPPTITNNGTWQKTGAGMSDIEPSFTNYGSVLAQAGTMHFTSNYSQSSGATTLGAGGIEVDNPMVLNGGTLDGAGTVTGDVDNDATVNPGNGTTGVINITGDYTQGLNGALAIGIAGPSAGQFDQLNVTGTATLSGAFSAALLSGYTPTTGTTWNVLTFASNSGTFLSESLPPTITSSYGPTAYTLQAVAPSTDLSAGMIGTLAANAGAPLSYTVTITNGGPNTTAGTTTVVNTLPAGVTGASGSGTNWSCGAPSGGTITCTSTDAIVNGASYPTITFTMTAPTTGGVITNSATVSSPYDSNAANNTASVNTTITEIANLHIVKAGPNSITAGQNIVYTITVTNNGPSSANSVVVTDPDPAGATFVSNSGGCTTAFPCSLGILTSGQVVTITSTFSTSPSISGNLTNTATVSSTTADPDSSNNTSTKVTTVTASATADLSIAKSGPPTIAPGSNITYTITVTNNGPSSAASVVVTDPDPAGTTFVSNSGGCITAYPCNLGTLTSGQIVTITSTYNVPPGYASPTVANTATVGSATTDSNNANNSSTVTTAVLSQTDVAITKSGPATFSNGTPIVYTINVTNNGPLPAANVFVTDPTPAGLTFASNTGACTTPFPCALGTLASGQTVTITSTFNVPPGYAGTTVVNTASVSTSTTELNLANNSSTTTANAGPSTYDVSIVKTGPGAARQFELINFTITVTNNGPGSATNVVVSDPPSSSAVWVSNSGACTTPFPCNLGTLAPTASATITATYRVSSAGGQFSNTATVATTPADSNTANNSSTAVVGTGVIASCPAGGPSLSQPANNAVVSSPVNFTWSSVANAIGYTLTITPANGTPPTVITTGSTNASATLPPGAYSWTVAASGAEACRPMSSAPSSFVICPTILSAPIPSVVGETTTGQTYSVAWTQVDGASTYELQESTSPAFTNPTTTNLAENGKTFTKHVAAPTAFWYRVRAIASCNPVAGPFSQAISVVVVPVPSPNNHDPNVNVPDGSHTPVTWQIFVAGSPDGSSAFIATVDRPWLSVSPTSGILPPEGMNFTISADPSALTNGTWTGTLIIVFGTTSVGAPISDDTKTTTIPISISLVSPVTPTQLTAASNSALIVPSVGHLAGIESLWRSDIRLANLATNAQRYQLTFNAGAGGDATSTKQTTVTVDAGATMALDDIVRNWYGIGGIPTASSGGLLTVQPLDAAGKPLANLSNVSAVSSRTFNASSTGTLGQFIPAVPFAKFIGRSGGGTLAQALSMQQIAQSSAYRTNLGIVEAAGKSANVVVSAFDGGGTKLFDLPLSLQAGEQKTLNSFLAANGVTSLANGRVEVRVTGGDGKVTAYASVVDNASSDPLLIAGTAIDSVGANRFVVPGIADISGGGSNWRSDMRVFNAGAAPQNATLTFYPSASGTPVTAQVNIAPGEIKQLDDVLHSTLGVTNLGGALHVTTNVSAPLVVTARTYDQTSKGTLGQFIPAVTTTDAVGRLDRALQILQGEESNRYRTNVGVVEVTGKAATAEITVILPNTKVTPVIQVPLAAFESKQIPVLSALGLGAVYNARVSVRVIDGDGRVTAYGSVIDNATKDPTFIPAQ